MPRSYLRFAAAGLLASTVACGVITSARLHGRRTSESPSLGPGTVPGTFDGRPAEPTPRSRGAGSQPNERLVCRSTIPPTGWIAVAYVSASGQCPARRGADSAATAAVLTRYADSPVGALLDVCADQRIPRNWAIVRDEVADEDRCPGAVRGDGPTMTRIRRLQ